MFLLNVGCNFGYRVSNKGPKIQESTTLAPITHDHMYICALLLPLLSSNAAVSQRSELELWLVSQYGRVRIDVAVHMQSKVREHVPKSQAYNNMQGMIGCSELSTVLIRAHQFWKPSNFYPEIFSYNATEEKFVHLSDAK
jgi:hypothetical protein